MRRDLVYRDEIMDSLVKEYNRKRTNDGLKLAWIEKAVNDVKPAPIDVPDKNVGEKIFGQIDIEALRAALLAWSYMPEWRDNKIIEAVKQAQQIQINNNVGELISRQAAIDAVGKLCDGCDNGGWCGECRIDYPDKDAIDVLEALPPAEPKRGKWIRVGSGSLYDYYKCSECGEQPKWDCMGDNRWKIAFTDFCPNCGADMRQKGENSESD